MKRDLDPDDVPGLELAALVVVLCIIGAAAVMAVSALWGMFG